MLANPALLTGPDVPAGFAELTGSTVLTGNTVLARNAVRAGTAGTGFTAPPPLRPAARPRYRLAGPA